MQTEISKMSDNNLVEKFEEENPDEIISYKDFKKHFNLN